MSKLYIIFILLNLCFSQSSKYSGVLLEEGSEDPLMGVYFQVDNSEEGGVTDSNGEFFFSNKESSLDVTFNYVGYNQLKVKLKSAPNDNVIYLKPSVLTGDEVTLFAVRDIIENTIKKYNNSGKLHSDFTVNSNTVVHYKGNIKLNKRLKKFKMSKSYTQLNNTFNNKILSKSNNLKTNNVFKDLTGDSFSDVFGDKNGEFITPLNVKYFKEFDYKFPKYQSYNGDKVYIIYAKKENENGFLQVKMFIEVNDYNLKRVETFFRPKSSKIDTSFGNGITKIYSPETGKAMEIPFNEIERKTITYNYFQIGKKTMLKQYQVFQASKNTQITYSEIFNNYKTSFE